MITSPWTSTVLRQSQPLLKNILSEIAMAKAEGGLVAENDAVVFVTPLATKVPAFIGPITSEEYGDRKLFDKGEVMIDARSFMRAERRSDVGFVVNNVAQSDFFARMGSLTAIWIKNPEYRMDYLRVGNLAAQSYIAWFSQAIGYKLGLDIETNREVQVLTALYYIHLHVDADTALSKREQEKFIHMILQWTRAPIDLVTGIVENAPYMMLLEDYVAYLHQHFANNTRITQINVGFLVMSMGRAWFGYGAHVLAGIATEYPPVFLTLIEAACNSKVWKKTQLGKIVERLDSKGESTQFLRSMKTLVMQASAESFDDTDLVEGEIVVSQEGMVSGRGVTDDEIIAAEADLDLTFPLPYRNFLKEHGTAVIGNSKICGLGGDESNSVVTMTLHNRKALDLPRGWFIIEDCGMEDIFFACDEVGLVHMFSKAGCRNIQKGFEKFIGGLIAFSNQEAFLISKPFAKAEYAADISAFVSTEMSRWWGRREVTIDMISPVPQGGQVSEAQKTSYVHFKQHIDAWLLSIFDILFLNIGANFHHTNKNNVFDSIVPTRVVFEPNGNWILYFNSTSGEAALVVRDGDRIRVGSQSIHIGK